MRATLEAVEVSPRADRPRRRCVPPSWIAPVLILVLGFGATLLALGVPALAQQGHDSYGYNYAERRFSGFYENADRDTTNNSGDQTRLLMEWSDLVNLADPRLSQVGAWVTNFQKGTYVGADGQPHRWSYSVKLVFNGAVFTIDQETYVDAGGSATVHHRPPVLPTGP